MRRALLLIGILPGLFATTAHASELKPETVVAFDRYVRATEARMEDDLRHDHFLAIDRLADLRQQKAYRRVQNGALYIQKLRTLEDGRAIEIPSGLIHHWVAVIFVPGIKLSEALAVLQDYDNHQDFYNPEVRKSQLLERNGNDFKIYLQFYEKSIVTAVFNANFDVTYAQFGSTQFDSASRSTRIVEIEDLGKPNERELPVGKDRGFLWRLNSYWRVEEKDGGVYLQNESVALTRRVPRFWRGWSILCWRASPGIPSRSFCSGRATLW